MGPEAAVNAVYANKIAEVEAFYRLPGASEREGGVGLGLSLVKTIVERHGGRIWCETSPGEGCCFLFQLPLAEPVAVRTDLEL